MYLERIQSRNLREQIMLQKFLVYSNPELADTLNYDAEASSMTKLSKLALRDQ